MGGLFFSICSLALRAVFAKNIRTMRKFHYRSQGWAGTSADF
jgi:hypothetical protein